jgi:hypothetical protein
MDGREGEVMRHKPLTEHLRDSNSPVKQFLKRRFPRTAGLTKKANLQLQSEDTINPGFRPERYNLLSTAISYRIRYSFAITPGCQLAAWEGAMSLPFIWDDYPNPQGLHSSGVDEDFFDSLDVTVKAIAPVRQRLNDEQEKLLARYCYVLALFEQLYRDTASCLYSPLLIPGPKQSVDELLEIPTDAEIDDLCAMSWLFYDRYHDLLSLRSILSRALKRCGVVSESDVDLIVDGCLMEIEASIKPEIKPLLLWQLAGYVLLDDKDKYRIRSVGIYMARQGKLLQWPIVDFLRQLTENDVVTLAQLAQLRQEFRMLCLGVRLGRRA